MLHRGGLHSANQHDPPKKGSDERAESSIPSHGCHAILGMDAHGIITKNQLFVIAITSSCDFDHVKVEKRSFPFNTRVDRKNDPA
jgi:hypothetical protein